MNISIFTLLLSTSLVLAGQHSGNEEHKSGLHHVESEGDMSQTVNEEVSKNENKQSSHNEHEGALSQNEQQKESTQHEGVLSDNGQEVQSQAGHGEIISESIQEEVPTVIIQRGGASQDGHGGKLSKSEHKDTISHIEQKVEMSESEHESLKSQIRREGMIPQIEQDEDLSLTEHEKELSLVRHSARLSQTEHEGKISDAEQKDTLLQTEHSEDLALSGYENRNSNAGHERELLSDIGHEEKLPQVNTGSEGGLSHTEHKSEVFQTEQGESFPLSDQTRISLDGHSSDDSLRGGESHHEGLGKPNFVSKEINVPRFHPFHVLQTKEIPSPPKVLVVEHVVKHYFVPILKPYPVYVENKFPYAMEGKIPVKAIPHHLPFELIPGKAHLPPPYQMRFQ